MRQLIASFLLVPLLAGTASAAAPSRAPLAADTPMATVAGNTFIAPVGWRVSVEGPATVVEAPEGESRIALVDVSAKDAEQAVALAWKAYRRGKTWPLKVVTPLADRDGW